jgi:hypothetical protein
LNTGMLPLSHRESVICLLGKKGKDKRFISNLRPITLSNCDIKVITKAITKRCNSFLNCILNPHQTAYVPGRIVHDNLRTIDLIKDLCNKKQIDGYLVSLDAKKAFDSVDHKFIDDVLCKFNFCDEFRKTVKILYNNITSRVLVNGHLTDEFPILRSVKQGDALSCVLFILCMETIINAIEGHTYISNITIDQIRIPKVFSYADDIAVLVSNVQSIRNVVDCYGRFSRVSGLYLNVDKTEIINLNKHDSTDRLSISDSNSASSTVIEFSKSITICGRVFSLDHGAEYKSNILSKIDNLQKALNSWNKRSLSIYGRNLIIKTFGLSQLIYSMQNSHFSKADLASIEKICFNFLWRKKPDKSKAYERISRFKLKQPPKQGGLGAPDIVSINDALKIGQFLRSTSENCTHFINIIQTQCFKINPNLLFQRLDGCNNNFLMSVSESLHKIGDIMIDEILSSNCDNKLSKYYYDLIASEDMVSLVSKQCNNPIILSQVKTLRKKLGLSYVGQLINEYKFPSSDYSHCLAKNIVSACGSLFKKLIERKVLTYGISFRDHFFTSTNHSITCDKITTKLLRMRLFNTSITDVSTRYNDLHLISHPKEREIAFFHLHDALLPNARLYEMKLIPSPLCPLCDTEQTSEHIFLECINIKNSNGAVKHFSTQLHNNRTLNANISSLIKRMCYLNKDKKLTTDIFRIAIQDRINDLNYINFSKEKRKNIDIINRITLL